MSSQISKNTSASCKRHSTDTFGTNGGVSLATINVQTLKLSHRRNMARDFSGNFTRDSIETGTIRISSGVFLIFPSTHHTRHVLTWSPRSICIRARGLNWASRLSTSLTWATRSTLIRSFFFQSQAHSLAWWTQIDLVHCSFKLDPGAWPGVPRSTNLSYVLHDPLCALIFGTRPLARVVVSLPLSDWPG